MNNFKIESLNNTIIFLSFFVSLFVNLSSSNANNSKIALDFENVSQRHNQNTDKKIDSNRLNRAKKSQDILAELPKLITKTTAAQTFNVTYKKTKYLIAAINSKYNDLKISSNTSGLLQGLEYHFLKNPDATILMNAGMFEADGSSVGLLITENKILNKINLRSDLPGNFYSMRNAIFYLDKNAKYNVIETSAFNEKFKNKYEGITFATQSGPVLNIEGKINKEFNIKSTNKLIRNGIGVLNNSKYNIAILIISETPTTFYELASLYEYLGCNNAMYLDGTVSTMFCKNNKNKKDKPKPGGMKLGPIFVIKPKLASKTN